MRTISRPGALRPPRHPGWAASAVVLAAFFAVSQVHAATVSARASQNSVRAGERFSVWIEATVENNQPIEILRDPDFGASFHVVQSNNSTSVQVVNGRASRQLRRGYQVQPTEPGTFTIAGAEIKIGDQVLKPNSITITVTPGAAPSAPAQPGPQPNHAQQPNRAQQPDDRPAPGSAVAGSYVAHKVYPTDRPYVGQQVTLVYWLYSDAFGPTAQPQPPDEPSLDEFWIEDLNEGFAGQRQTVRVDGRPMTRTNLRAWALFPLAAGKAVVEPLELDVFTGGFLQGQQQFRLKSAPVTIDVRPLPPNAPASFHEGNVGEWQFEVTTTRIQAKMGEPITVRVRARGNGQADRLSLPKLPDIPGTRVVNQDTRRETRIENSSAQSSSTLEYTLLADQEGTLSIPALEFSYFDPVQEAYKTARSAPISIEIAGGKPMPADQAPKPVAPAEQPHEPSMLDSLVAQLPAPRTQVSLTEAPAPLTRSVIFWILLALPALGLLGLTLEGPLRRHRRRASPRKKRGDAYKTALAHLDDPNANPLDAARDALTAYVTEVAQIPAGAISAQDFRAQLTRRGVPADLAAQLAELLERINARRYAPTTATRGANTDAALVEDCRRCLVAIEDARRAGIWHATAASAGLFLLAAAAFTAVCMTSITPAYAQQSPPSATTLLEKALAAQTAAQSDENAHAEPADAHAAWVEVARQWEAVHQAHPDSADVLFNLGLAYVHQGDLGRARLALERAALLAPSSADISAARDLLQRIVRLRQIEAVRGLTASRNNTASEGLFWWRLASSISPTFLPILLVALSWLLLAGMLAHRLLRAPAARQAVFAGNWFVALVLCACALSWVARAQILANTHAAVILADSVRLREGPSAHAGLTDTRTLLLPGSVVHVQEQRDGWVQLDLDDGSAPWTRARNVEFILPQ